MGSLSVAAGIYNSATVTFSGTVLTIDNQSGSTINSTCLTGTICKISLPAGSATASVTPFPLTLISAEKTGVSLNLNLKNALTLTGGTLALSFSATNVFTAQTLPRVGITSGTLDNIHDFVGMVTAVSANLVTVQSGDGISLQFTLPASPVIEDPQALCSAQNISCLVANQTVVSVDGTVNTDGTLSLVSADLLDASPRDELEGIVVTNGVAGQFLLVVTNKIVASGNTTVAGAKAGDIFTVTLSAPSFIVDTDEFFNNASFPAATISTLFTSEADLVNGQDVMLHLIGAAGSAAAGNQTVTTDQVRLRFTRTSGTIVSLGAQTLTMSNIPPFIPFVTNPVVQTILGVSTFDGTTDLNSLSAGQRVSIRALLLRNSAFNFYAAQVRLQP